jgi:hypothetical protein
MSTFLPRPVRAAGSGAGFCKRASRGSAARPDRPRDALVLRSAHLTVA